MATTSDSLNAAQIPTRVFYRTGRMLGVEDFHSEQDYHRGRLARALVQVCGTGTVSGLKVQTDHNADLNELEIEVTAGIALDRLGRIIEVPRTVCIRLKHWLDQQSDSDLRLAFKQGTHILLDVFATFVACTRGKTPCFASQDDFDATDAFSANRWLDSFAMQLVLRTDAAPKLPGDPWLAAGAHPTAAQVQQLILDATAGPAAAAVEYPPQFDGTSVFLARIQVAATESAPGARPAADLTQIAIDNLSRLFVYPAALVSRWAGLSSGTET